MESFFEVRTKGDTWLTPAWPRGSLWGIPGPGLRDPHYEILSGTHTKCMSPVLLLLFFNVCYLHLLCLETKLPPCSVKYQVLVFPAGGPFLASQSLPSLSLEGLWGRRIPAPKRWWNTGHPAFQPLWVLQEVGVEEGLLPDFLGGGWEETFSCLWTLPPSIRCSEVWDIWSHHFMGNRWGNNGNSGWLYFLGFQNHCRWWLQSWN